MPERKFDIDVNAVVRVNLTPALKVRIQNKGQADLQFAASAGNNAPDFSSDSVADIDIVPTQVATFDFEEHFPGVPNADTLWVTCRRLYGNVSASYA